LLQDHDGPKRSAFKGILSASFGIHLSSFRRRIIDQVEAAQHDTEIIVTESRPGSGAIEPAEPSSLRIGVASILLSVGTGNAGVQKQTGTALAIIIINLHRLAGRLADWQICRQR
jgi:hypothetical protein